MLGISLILTKKQKGSFKMKKIICLLILMSFAGFVMAHWDPIDGHKMHNPQLPDPNGWDV